MMRLCLNFPKGSDGKKHTVATFQLTLEEQLIFIS